MSEKGIVTMVERDFGRSFMFEYSPPITAELAIHIFEQAVINIAESVAKSFIEQHLREVLALITPEAIATMTMARCAAEVNKTLKEEVPDKVLEVVKTEVRREIYQKGLFGKLTRIG